MVGFSHRNPSVPQAAWEPPGLLCFYGASQGIGGWVVRQARQPQLSFTCCVWQISDIQVSGQSEDMTAKEKLLLWSQRMVEGYQGLRCDNFTTSWRDGRLFNAIIHRHKYVAPRKAGAGSTAVG